MPNKDIFDPPTEENQAQGRNLQRTKPMSIPSPSDAPPATVGEMPLTAETAIPQQVEKNPNVPIVDDSQLFPVQPPQEPAPSASQLATPPQSSQPTQDGQQQPSQVNPLQFNVPSILDSNKYLPVTGGQAGFIDPSIELQSGAAYNQGKLDPYTLIQNVQGIPYQVRDNLPDTSNSLDGQIDRVEEMRRNSQQNWNRYYKTRQTIIDEENYNRQADFSLTPKIPTIDGDVSTNGLSSELGRALQDTFDPKRKRNKVGTNGITDWLFRDTGNLLNKYFDWAENQGDDPTKGNWFTRGVGTVTSNILNPLGNFQEAFYPEWKKQQETEHNKSFQETLVRIGSRKVDGKIGDYGNAGLVSAALQLGNTAWSALNGLAYDVVDNTLMRLHNGGVDPHKGVRVWQAIFEQRDWGLESQWSPEKYLSWSEPEDIRGKGKTPANYFNEVDPKNTVPGYIRGSARNWWDLPENTGELLSRKFDKNGNLTTEINKEQYNKIIRPLHWLIQGVPTYSVSFLGNGGLDALTGVAASLAVSKVRPVASAINKFDDVVKAGDIVLDTVANANRIAQKLPDGLSIQVPRNMEGVRGLHAPPVNKPVRQATNQLPKTDIVQTENLVRLVNPDHVNDIVIPVKKGLPVVDKPIVANTEDFVTHTVKSNLLDSPELVPPRLLETVPRNSDDITILAKRLIGSDGNPLLDVRRSSILTDNEIGALRSIDSINLSEHGLPVNRVIDNANVLNFGKDTELVQLPKYPHLKDDGLPYDDILGINSRNASYQYESLTKKLKVATSLEEQSELQSKRIVALAKLADEGEAYTVVKERFPRLLQGDSQEVIEKGNLMVSKEVQLAGEGEELRKIDMNVRDLQSKVNNLAEKQGIYPSSRGNLNNELSTKEFYSGIPESRLSNNDVVNPVPLPREVKIGKDFSVPNDNDLVAFDDIFPSNLEDPKVNQLAQLLMGNNNFDTIKVKQFIAQYLDENPDASIFEIKRVFEEHQGNFEGSRLFGDVSLDGNPGMPPKVAELIDKIRENTEPSYMKYLLDGTRGDTANMRLFKKNIEKAKPAFAWWELKQMYKEGSPVSQKFTKEVDDMMQRLAGVKINFGTTDVKDRIITLSKATSGLAGKIRQFVQANGIQDLYMSHGHGVAWSRSWKTGEKELRQALEEAFPKGTKVGVIVCDTEHFAHFYDPSSWKIWTVGDDTAWLKVPIEGRESFGGYDIERYWKHGTTSTADIRAINPVEGASSSEFGKGIYLTLNDDVAKAAALKGNLPNRPYPSSASDDFSKPRIHTVDVSSLEEIINGGETANRTIKDAWYRSADDAIESTLGETANISLPHTINNEDLFNHFHKAYYDWYGEEPSEITVDAFQRNLTNELIDVGYEGMYSQKNGIKTLAVYVPYQTRVESTLGIDRLGTTMETMEAKRFLEGVTANQLGDDVSMGRYVTAQKELADYQLQRAVEAKLAKEQHITELIDDVTGLEGEIVSRNANVHTENMKDTINYAPKRIDETFSEPILKIRTDPC